ncbi:MAG: hypothetical protein Q9195_006742 [Heterodermia aff. obscurata]
MASNLSSSLGLASLPNENLCTIFAYAMLSPGPVDLPSCIHRGSNTWESPPREPSSYEEWLNRLDRDQKQHQTDWIVANSISRRLRAIGKEAFFANKTFALGWREISQMEEGNLVGMGTLNTSIAVSHINAVQALVPGKSISGLPRFTFLPKLRYLQFQQSGIYAGIFETDRESSSGRGAKLITMLKGLNCTTKNVAEGESMVQFELENGSTDATQRLNELVRMIFGNYC